MILFVKDIEESEAGVVVVDQLDFDEVTELLSSVSIYAYVDEFENGGNSCSPFFASIVLNQDLSNFWRDFAEIFKVPC